MLTDGKITQAQYDEAKATPITPAITAPTQGCVAANDIARSAYFCEYVKSVVLNDPAFGDTADAHRDLLRQGGLKIYSTMNVDIQNAGAQAMLDTVPGNYDNQYFGAAGVSLETTTGRVLAPSLPERTKSCNVDIPGRRPGRAGGMTRNPHTLPICTAA